MLIKFLNYFGIHNWKYYKQTRIVKRPYSNRSFKHVQNIRECKWTGLKQRRKDTSFHGGRDITWININY